MHQTSDQVKIVDLDFCDWLACLLTHEIFSKDETRNLKKEKKKNKKKKKKQKKKNSS